MTKKRTSLLVLVAALAVLSSGAPAQGYRTKPIRMVVAQAAGGPHGNADALGERTDRTRQGTTGNDQLRILKMQ